MPRLSIQGPERSVGTECRYQSPSLICYFLSLSLSQFSFSWPQALRELLLRYPFSRRVLSHRLTSFPASGLFDRIVIFPRFFCLSFFFHRHFNFHWKLNFESRKRAAKKMHSRGDRYLFIIASWINITIECWASILLIRELPTRVTLLQSSR